MTWVRIRSRRDPAAWVPVVLVILALATLTGYLQSLVSGAVGALEEARKANPEAAAARAVELIRLCEAALCVSSVAFGVFLFRFSWLGLRESRLPPTGWWSLGAWRIAVGARARRMARIGMCLSFVFPTSALAIVLIVESLLRSFAERGLPV